VLSSLVQTEAESRRSASRDGTWVWALEVADEVAGAPWCSTVDGGRRRPVCELELELVHGEQRTEEVMVSDRYQKNDGKMMG
jgi:hypothetical protein